MAAAEARAAWQRTANRCFVQEDAKRAPKLACCPSSSTSSKQVDAGPACATDGSDHPSVGFTPLSRIPSSSNLPPDAKWWLLLQSNSGYQKALTYEQLNALVAEVEIMKSNMLSPASKFGGDRPQKEEDSTLVDTTASLKNNPIVRKQELKAVYGENAQELEDIKEYYEIMEMDVVGCSVSKQSNDLSFDSESIWFGSEKTEPWWRTTDRDELASLVAQKSLDHVENCDLPPPQKMHVRRDLFASLGQFDHDVVSKSSDFKVQSGVMSNLSLHSQSSPTLGSTHGRQWTSVEEGHPSYGSERPFSSACKDLSGMGLIPESDFSKAQLLEALCHSQTRAREAEKEAKQAEAEKEHVVKLFFRQASLLFAYKQWFQLLQLQSLYLQLKNNDQPISNLFPAVFPRMPSKSRKLRKTWQKANNRKRGKRAQLRYDISKCTLAFALGLSFVGAGLLLGWTVGWMLPAF